MLDNNPFLCYIYIMKIEKYLVGTKEVWFLVIKRWGSKTFGDAYAIRIR